MRAQHLLQGFPRQREAALPAELPATERDLRSLCFSLCWDLAVMSTRSLHSFNKHLLYAVCLVPGPMERHARDGQVLAIP